MNPVPLASALLACVAACPSLVGQLAPGRAKWPHDLLDSARKVAPRDLDAATVLEAAILLTNVNARASGYQIGPAKRIKKDGHTDVEVGVRFGKGRQPRPLDASFVWAMSHNVEFSPLWRLRRLELRRAKGPHHEWLVDELVFGYREQANKDRELVTFPGTRATLCAALRLIGEKARVGDRRKTHAGVSCRRFSFDLSGEVPKASASIEASGADYKQRFRQFVAEANKDNRKAGRPFRSVCWRGDEQPIQGKQAARFHVDFLLPKAAAAAQTNAKPKADAPSKK